jgi:hypothetical protein
MQVPSLGTSLVPYPNYSSRGTKILVKKSGLLEVVERTLLSTVAEPMIGSALFSMDAENLSGLRNLALRMEVGCRWRVLNGYRLNLF